MKTNYAAILKRLCSMARNTFPTRMYAPRPWLNETPRSPATAKVKWVHLGTRNAPRTRYGGTKSSRDSCRSHTCIKPQRPSHESPGQSSTRTSPSKLRILIGCAFVGQMPVWGEISGACGLGAKTEAEAC